MADNWYSSKPNYTFDGIVNDPDSIPSSWGMNPQDYGGGSNFQAIIGHIFICNAVFNRYKFIGDSSYKLKSIYVYKDSRNSVYNTKERYMIKHPRFSATYASFESQGIIKLGDYYYQVYTEIDQKVIWSESITKANPTKTTFQPYEPIDLSGIKLEVVEKEQMFSSASYGVETIVATGTYSTWNEICQNADRYVGLPNIGYYNENDINTDKTISATFSGTIFSWTLNVDDFPHKKYYIGENQTEYDVYAGKEIGQKFLEHFSVKYDRWNEYKRVTTTIESTITKDRLSRVKWGHEDNNVAFSYAFNDGSLSFSSDKRIIQLADESTRYNMVTLKRIYQQGDTFDISAINIKECGSLLYSDGTSISFNEIEYLSEPTITSSLGDEPITLNELILGFTITCVLPTKHFGTLTHEFYIEVEGQTEDYITSVKLVGAKSVFNANEIIAFDDNARLECYNHNGDIIKTINYGDFSNYITENSVYYNQQVASILLVDEEITLNFKFQEFREFTWKIVINYYEPSLTLDLTNVKRKYFIGDKYGETVVLDKTGLVATAKYHNNGSQLGSIVECDVSDLVKLSCKDSIDVLTGTKVYSVTTSCTTEDTKQTLQANFDIEVVRYEAVKIEVSGNNDSKHYWDNDKDVFHYPTGLNFIRIYSDGTTENITDFSSLHFYRDSALTSRLEIGYSIIRKSDGSRIYVFDSITRATGSFIIQFKEDRIVNVELTNNVNFVLGNRFNSIKNILEINALHESGIETKLETYFFKNNKIIMQEESAVNVIVDEKEYNLNANNKITFVKPNISEIEIDHSKFPMTYNNITDHVDASKITLSVHYENAEYAQECHFKSGQDLSGGKFLVLCADMPNFAFDGSETLNLEMGDYFEKVIPLTFKVQNVFDTSSEVNNTATLNISVIEITEITGMSLINVYRDYYVNDTFLNGKDTTEILIFYKDTNGKQKRLQIKLNSGFSAINIYPLKGTKFTSIDDSKTIRITSATNYNIACEYDISVSLKYIFSQTKTRNLVAVFQELYELPNGNVIADKYVLISKYDEKGLENTKITSSGERVLADGKDIDDDIKVFGYIDDAFDETKNGRVILFEDYISPIEGSNNIEVKFPCYVPKNADRINKCQFGILFGNNNAKNRLFLSGNPDYPNCDWHSGQVDSTYLEDETMLNGNFGYFEDTSYCYYGETDNAIVGYDIVSNDKLMVLKSKSDKETTIYFRTPILVAAIDGAGNSMTGIDGETLYQEEFSLTKGNNSVAGVSPKAIANFNGDSLFISEDKNILGLDLTGIIGDNQRYANSRSYYIDTELKRLDLTGATLWSNNKYLFLMLKDKMFITHFETKHNNQYEWFVLNVKDIQTVLEYGEKKYLANSNGEFFVINKSYDDIKKIFIGMGGSLMASEGDKDNEIIVSKNVIEKLNSKKNFTFKVISQENIDTSYMYYKIASISNVKINCDILVQKENNCFELVGDVNGSSDYDRINFITKMIIENKVFYLNHAEGENEISAFPGSPIKEYYKKYFLKRYIDDSVIQLNDCYKLYDAMTGNEIDISQLYRANLCCKLDGEYSIVNIDKDRCSFNISQNNKVIDLVRYANQEVSKAFKAEIREYSPVEAFYITKPFDMGSLDYFKTIWSWTLTNDTSIPSELDVAHVSNKIPFEKMRTLAKISKEKISFDLNDLDFRKLDLQKNIVPRTYTQQRIISQLKFICFGFRNNNNTNSVLSSMSIVYTVPFPSYGGD